ncbi:MAG: phenylalanine--tRNA ligase subunit alpha [Candidatus Micrarchaeaceae archaeon]
MHRYELSILKALKEKGGMGLEDLISLSNIGRDETMWSLENLKEKGMVRIDYEEEERAVFSDEGRVYADSGLPEELLIKRIYAGKEEIKPSELDDKGKLGLQWAKRDGMVEIAGGVLKLTAEGRKAAAEKMLPDRHLLKELLDNPEDDAAISRNKERLRGLEKRGLVRIEKHKRIKRVEIEEKGIEGLEGGASDSIDSVDGGIIASGAWEGRDFKRYDVNVNVERQAPARRHPMKRLLDDLKDAYVSMGFREVSGPAVESSFWVFDSLFVPQDHPARDAQDTFYVSNLDKAAFDDVPHVKTIKRAHEKGWHTKWKEDTAGQMLLRTHTTSVSSRYLYSVINDFKQNPEKYELPVKLFSIGRVFRNETVDYRHLADFYQMDGLIIGKGLTLSNLFDQITKIYNYIGMKIKFKPSYFPFVEPGAEFMAYSEKSDEWIELGGAGMIREEITGIKRSKLSVLAWGPGIDRILLINDPTISNISELYNNDIGWVRDRRGE